MRFTKAFSVGVGALLALTHSASAHSWIERGTKIANGALDETAFGYARGPIPRMPGWSDNDSVWMMPENGAIPADKRMCKWGAADNKAALLQLAPGDQLALRYLENGHVTMPDVPPGHPTRSGVVFVYATTQARDTDTFEQIHRVWNAAGTGGDQRGRLIATRYYDDGQCYEANPSPLSQSRQALNPKVTGGIMGPNVWCQSDVTIPADMTGTVSLYWVWDWPILKDPAQQPFQYMNGEPTGVPAHDGTSSVADQSVINPQTYTSCMDVTVSASNQRRQSDDMQASETAAQAPETAVLVSEAAAHVLARGMDMDTAIVQEQINHPFLAEFGDLTTAGTATPGMPAPLPNNPPAAGTARSSPIASTSASISSTLPGTPATSTTATATTTPTPDQPASGIPTNADGGSSGNHNALIGDGPITVTVTAAATTITVSATPVTVTAGGADLGDGASNGCNGSTLTRTASTLTRTATTFATITVSPTQQQPGSSMAPVPTGFMRRRAAEQAGH